MHPIAHSGAKAVVLMNSAEVHIPRTASRLTRIIACFGNCVAILEVLKGRFRFIEHLMKYNIPSNVPLKFLTPVHDFQLNSAPLNMWLTSSAKIYR